MKFLSNAGAVLSALAAKNPLELDAVIAAAYKRPRVILAGMGKSFLVSQFAARMANSFGLPWSPMDVASAGHGDAGLMHPSDLLIVISKSGEGEELLKFVRWMQDLSIVAICTNRESRLVVLSDCAVILDVPDEHSLHGHAPMTSSIAFLAVLFEVINRVAADSCSEEQYLSLHPAGSIGDKAW